MAHPMHPRMLFLAAMFCLACTSWAFAPSTMQVSRSALISRSCLSHNPIRLRMSTIMTDSAAAVGSTLIEISTPKASNVKLIEPPLVGLKKDLERKAPKYVSDFKDGFTTKTLSSTFFLFFACIAPAIAFGGALGKATGGQMGTVETIGATAIGGITYALFSGQPLTIIGTTGPLLAFVKVLYDSCQAASLPFLPIYGWVGLWSAFYLSVSSVLSMSNVVMYFTKFTDEIFSMLISVIFIYEAVKDIVLNFSNPAIGASSAMMSFIAAMVTYLTATKLSQTRRTPFFNRPVRETLSDFAPTIAVASGMLASLAASKRYGLSLPTLAVPEMLTTTMGRPWLVNLFSVPVWVRLAAAIPALMATVLLFMDQNITVRLVMSKEHKLTKGSGVHLDMAVISFVTALFSVLGMPWMVAATVRSMAHVRSLTNVEQTEDGSLKIESVQEQRLSGLSIHMLIGAAMMFCRPLLRQIPVSILTGLFLYLGTSSLGATDLFQRVKMFWTDPARKPKAKWATDIPITRTNIFTAIQMTSLGSMWWLKGTKLGVLFPVLIGLLAPLRVWLEKGEIFSKKEIEILDENIGQE